MWNLYFSSWRNWPCAFCLVGVVGSHCCSYAALDWMGCMAMLFFKRPRFVCGGGLALMKVVHARKENIAILCSLFFVHYPTTTWQRCAPSRAPLNGISCAASWVEATVEQDIVWSPVKFCVGRTNVVGQ